MCIGVRSRSCRSSPSACRMLPFACSAAASPGNSSLRRKVLAMSATFAISGDRLEHRRVRAKDALDPAKPPLLIGAERPGGPGDKSGAFERFAALAAALRKKLGQRGYGALLVEREQESLALHSALQLVERRSRRGLELVDHPAGEVVRPLVEHSPLPGDIEHD